MNDDEMIILLLPEGLRPLYGKGIDDMAENYTDLVGYAYRPTVRTGGFPPIFFASHAFDSKDAPLAFIVGDETEVHGVKVKVVDYEFEVYPGFGSRGPVNVWTVYVDETSSV